MRKRNNYKNIFGMRFTVSVFALAAVGNAQAQECAALPTCEEFGYLYTAEDCAGQKYVKCPFDQTKYFCLEDNNKCDTCEGYAYTYAQATATGYVIDGDGCQSCDGMKYKRKAAPCIGFDFDETNCPTTSCSGPGGGSCPSGSKIKYRTCNNRCHQTEPKECYGPPIGTNIVCGSCTDPEGCGPVAETIPCPEGYYCCSYSCHEFHASNGKCIDAERYCCEKNIVPCD